MSEPDSRAERDFLREGLTALDVASGEPKHIPARPAVPALAQVLTVFAAHAGAAATSQMARRLAAVLTAQETAPLQYPTASVLDAQTWVETWAAAHLPQVRAQEDQVRAERINQGRLRPSAWEWSTALLRVLDPGLLVTGVRVGWPDEWLALAQSARLTAEDVSALMAAPEGREQARAIAALRGVCVP